MKVFYGGFFIEREILLEAGIQHPIKLEYYKIINKDGLTSKNRETYGIEIVKTEYIDNNTQTEEKELKFLSNDEKKVDKILKLFKRNAVTPVAAEDVVEDLLKQRL